jgi:phage terminase small subunit
MQNQSKTQAQVQHQLQKLDNETLLKQTRDLASEERKITLEILSHLREINRRRLFALRGYSSLFEYVTRELGYSDASASRRIAAMRLIAELPEVENKIKEGTLSLSNAAQAQKLFQTEQKAETPKSPEEKKAIIQSIENKSTRDAEKTLISHSSQPANALKPDRVKPVTQDQSEVRFVADQKLLDQLEQIKGLLAHKNSNMTLAELIGEMAKLSLEKLQPKPPKPSQTPQDHSGAGAAPTQVLPKRAVVKNSRPTSQMSRYVPAEVKRAVYHRDGGKCCYVDRATGRRCNSTFGIEYEHIRPFAQGGNATVYNIQILCKSHNQLRAIAAYGEQKMSRYLGKR